MLTFYTKENWIPKLQALTMDLTKEMKSTAREGAITMMINRRSCIVRPKLVGWLSRAIATCLCCTVFNMHLEILNYFSFVKVHFRLYITKLGETVQVLMLTLSIQDFCTVEDSPFISKNYHFKRMWESIFKFS